MHALSMVYARCPLAADRRMRAVTASGLIDGVLAGCPGHPSDPLRLPRGVGPGLYRQPSSTTGPNGDAQAGCYGTGSALPFTNGMFEKLASRMKRNKRL